MTRNESAPPTSFAVQRIGRIGIEQQLRQKNLKNIDKIKHRRPSLRKHWREQGREKPKTTRTHLIDHIETDAAAMFVDVWMIDLVCVQANTVSDTAPAHCGRPHTRLRKPIDGDL